MENVNLNMIPGRVLPVCHASQYDIGRQIRFNLFDGDQVFAFASGDTAEIHLRKTDTTVITAALTITPGQTYVEVVTTEQMTAAAGSNIGEIEVQRSDVVLGSLNFILEVEADPLAGGIASGSVIEDLQAQVNAAISEGMTDINNDLNATKSLTGLRWFNGYYQTSNDRFVSTPYWKMSNAIPVTTGDTITYCGKAAQTSRHVVVFFNKAGSFLSGLSALGSDFVEVTFTIPANAEFMRVLAEPATLNKTYIIYGLNSGQNPLGENRKRIIAIEDNLSNIEIENQIAYVDGEAATNGIGTLTSPYNDIMSAIHAGYLNLKVKAGVYQIPLSIKIQNKNFNISLWSNKSSFDTNVPNREKIIIYRGDVLTPTSSGGLLVANYTPRSDKRFEKVFVSRTLAPIDSSFTLAVAYNTNVFLWKYGHKARRYEPVLPEDFTGASGTFTYDNGQIQLAPFNSDLNASGLNIYVSDDANILMYFENCGKVSVNSVAILGAYSGGIQLHGCQESIISDSDFICTGHGDGLEAWDSNVKLQNCLASGCCQDGYGFQHYGDSIMINCQGFYSGDDGVSHHRGCTGYIEGGEFSYNVSGGITPAFGATINIANVKTFNNMYGLQFLGASGYLKRNLLITNCLSKNNSVKDIYNSGYFIDFVNCVYDSQEATSGNENNFY